MTKTPDGAKYRIRAKMSNDGNLVYRTEEKTTKFFGLITKWVKRDVDVSLAMAENSLRRIANYDMRMLQHRAFTPVYYTPSGRKLEEAQ